MARALGVTTVNGRRAIVSECIDGRPPADRVRARRCLFELCERFEQQRQQRRPLSASELGRGFQHRQRLALHAPRGAAVEHAAYRRAGDLLDDLRRFLERSVHLAGVGDEHAALIELERAAAAAFGAAFNLRVVGTADLMARDWHTAMRES
mgnify:CR=1 FL=1